MINAQLTIEKKTIITIIKSTLSIIDDNKKTIEMKKVIACLLDDRGGHQKWIVMYLGQPTILHDCAY